MAKARPQPKHYNWVPRHLKRYRHRDFLSIQRSRSEAGSSLGTYGKQLTRLLHLVVGRPALLQVSFKSIDHEHLEVHD